MSDQTLADPPAPVPRGLRAIFLVRRAQRRQWPTAVRTSVSVAVPALVGLWAGDLAAGLLVSLGGFAALYGGGRPYLNRGRLLLGVALAQAVVVVLGIEAQAVPWLGVLAVTVIAAVATWVCNAFAIQPGAYQIALTCAVGTGLGLQGIDPVRAGLLVGVGGLIACLVSFGGALVDPLGPEREAVRVAADATVDYLEGIERRRAEREPEPAPDPAAPVADELDELRQRAGKAMHAAWIVLVNQQPRRWRTPRELLRLQEIGRRLQLLVADGMRRRSGPDSARRARQLGAQARRHGGPAASTGLSSLPMGRPSGPTMLRNALRPGSRPLLVIIRVSVAALVSGVVGGFLGLEHSYWAPATAVLVLSQGFDQRRTVQRGLERTVGTFAGVALAAVALNVASDGYLLVAMLAACLFGTQLLVQRNYAAAAVFITTSALLSAGAGMSTAASTTLLRARAADTALGCVIALVVFALLSNKTASGWLPSALGDVLSAAATATDHLTPAAVTSPTGLVARRDLQRQVIRLSESFENGLNGFPAQRTEALRVWPVVVAAERIAYRVLGESWRLEEVTRAQPGSERLDHPAVTSAPPSDGLRALADALQHGTGAGVLREVPSFLSRDVADLRRALRAG